jgi:hypothetical protein
VSIRFPVFSPAESEIITFSLHLQLIRSISLKALQLLRPSKAENKKIFGHLLSKRLVEPSKHKPPKKLIDRPVARYLK